MFTVFLSSYRNTSGTLGEREMLWEHEPQANVSTLRSKVVQFKMALSSGRLVTSMISPACRERKTRLLKDKTHLPTSPSGIFSRVLYILVRMRDSLLDSRGCSRTVSFVFEQSGSLFPARGLIILVTRRPELSTILN